MAGVYVPYCKNKMASEDLLASHRTYLSVRKGGREGGGRKEGGSEGGRGGEGRREGGREEGGGRREEGEREKVLIH